MKRHRLLLVMLSLMALCVFVPEAEATGCKTDVECKGDRICHQGQCIDPRNRPDQPSENRRQDKAAGRFLHSRANFHFNALGIFQFGLTPTLELGGESFTGLARLRIMNSGVLSYVLGADLDDDEWFVFGLGVGLGGRAYFTGVGSQRGFYVGGAVEYAYTRVDDDEDDMASYITHSLIPQAEAGYRWAWGRFFLGVGGVLGAAIPVASKDEPTGSDGCAYANSCTNSRDIQAYAMLTLDLGWFF